MTTTEVPTRPSPTRSDRRPTLEANDRFAPDLVEGAKRGDAAAWDEIYRLFGTRISHYAASRGIRDPEDVTQDVMYAAAKQIDQFVGDLDGLRSWLFTIAYRKCADHHRRSYRSPEETTDRVPEQPDQDGGADSALWSKVEVQEAFAALDVLDERERNVITLRVIGEMGTREVADALGLTRTNVRVIQSRALSKLRRYLEHNGGCLDRRFRNVFGLAAIALEKMGILRRWHYLREDLPEEGRLGAWIEALGREGPPSPSAVTPAAEVATGAFAGLIEGGFQAIGVVVIAAATVGATVTYSPTAESPQPTDGPTRTIVSHPGEGIDRSAPSIPGEFEARSGSEISSTPHGVLDRVTMPLQVDIESQVEDLEAVTGGDPTDLTSPVKTSVDKLHDVLAEPDVIGSIDGHSTIETEDVEDVTTSMSEDLAVQEPAPRTRLLEEEALEIPGG